MREYTGFTTKCKQCGEEVRSKYIGKNEEGVPSYELYCGCYPSKEKQKCIICDHNIGNRRRVGPTGKQDFTVLVDSCYGCGRLFPVFPDRLHHHQKDWIRRYNKKLKESYDNNKK